MLFDPLNSLFDLLNHEASRKRFKKANDRLLLIPRATSLKSFVLIKIPPIISGKECSLLSWKIKKSSRQRTFLFNEKESEAQQLNFVTMIIQRWKATPCHGVAGSIQWKRRGKNINFTYKHLARLALFIFLQKLSNNFPYINPHQPTQMAKIFLNKILRSPPLALGKWKDRISLNEKCMMIKILHLNLNWWKKLLPLTSHPPYRTPSQAPARASEDRDRRSFCGAVMFRIYAFISAK